MPFYPMISKAQKYFWVNKIKKQLFKKDVEKCIKLLNKLFDYIHITKYHQIFFWTWYKDLTCILNAENFLETLTELFSLVLYAISTIFIICKMFWFYIPLWSESIKLITNILINQFQSYNNCWKSTFWLFAQTEKSILIFNIRCLCQFVLL